MGYEYASDDLKIKNDCLPFLSNISLVDDGVLILDDIYDQSEIRNGKPCLYKEIGLQSALIEAELLKLKAEKNLFLLMNKLEILEKNKIVVVELFNKFLIAIYAGEKIDNELSLLKEVGDDAIKKYFEMVALFTGGHIKYSLEIGQLLANKEIDKNLSDIAVSAGIIRQICDDFDDYFSEHHEPFGDFINQKNRLPEIIFKISGGKREDVEKLLKDKEYNKAREIILNKQVRQRLYNFCLLELEKIKNLKTNFDYIDVVEDFERISIKA